MVCHSPAGFSAATRGRDPAVDAAHVVRVEGPAVGVGDLDLVDAAQVDAAVFVLGNVHFELQVEVLELGHGAEIAVGDVAAVLGLNGLVDEDPVLDGPAVLLVRIDQFPAVQVRAVEERRSGLPNLTLDRSGLGGRGGNPLAGELLLLDAACRRCWAGSASVASVSPSTPGHDGFRERLRADDFARGVLAFDLLEADDVQAVAVHVKTLSTGQDAAAAPEDAGVEIAVFLGDAQPAGAAAGDGQGPAPDVRDCRCARTPCRGHTNSGGPIRDP